MEDGNQVHISSHICCPLLTLFAVILPFIILLLFFTAGHQGDHDGAVLDSHGNTVLMNLKTHNPCCEHMTSD